MFQATIRWPESLDAALRLAADIAFFWYPLAAFVVVLVYGLWTGALFKD